MTTEDRKEGEDQIRQLEDVSVEGISESLFHSRLKWYVQLVIIVVVLFIAIGISYYWITHKPRAARKTVKPEASLVNAMSLKRCSDRIYILGMGSVEPARSIDLTSRVSGQIIQVSPNFVPGGVFKEGEVILRIDPEDYELALKKKELEYKISLLEIEQRRAELQKSSADIITAESALAI